MSHELITICPRHRAEYGIRWGTGKTKKMPTSLVVGCADVLLPVIKSMVNSSLSSGYFPSDWKQALITPLLKKEGLDPDFNNLRPVSNLQFVSKLTERAVFDQLQNHLMRFDFFPRLKRGVRHG